MSDLPTPEPVAQIPDQPLDIQHDPFPSEDFGIARRIPHLGHALLFFSMATMFLFLCEVLVAAVIHNRVQPGSTGDAIAAVIAEGLSYILTITASFYTFPLLWKYSFLRGIHWNGLAARRYWGRLVAAGVIVSMMAQLAERFVSEPKDPIIEHVMHTSLGAWTAMLMGTFLAPVIEEIAFRGFLLPAFATAYDWLSLERTPAGLRRWTMTTEHSRPALIFGALVSNVPFALLHAPQLRYTWGPVAVIYGVGLVLAIVRIRTHSVACSTLVHLTYNFTLFFAMLVGTGGFRHLERL